MIFKASLDKLAKGITIGISLLFLFIIVLQVIIGQDVSWITALLMSLFFILIYGVVYIFRPIHYLINPEGISIHRLYSDVKIPSTNIISVEYLDKQQMKWTIRTFGVGGLFGYFGKFANRTLGSMTLYATQRDHYVLIRTSDQEKIILTPDETTAFIDYFHATSR